MSEKHSEITSVRTPLVTSWVNLCFLVAHSEPALAIDLAQGDVQTRCELCKIWQLSEPAGLLTHSHTISLVDSVTHIHFME